MSKYVDETERAIKAIALLESRQRTASNAAVMHSGKDNALGERVATRTNATICTAAR